MLIELKEWFIFIFYRQLLTFLSKHYYMNTRKLFLIFFAAASLFACNGSSSHEESENNETEALPEVTATSENWGQTPGGPAKLYTLKNKNGIVATITDYGATLVSLITPDRDGNMGDITHGFDNVERYVEGHPYFGSTIGRYGNRIAKGEFAIDGETYTLAKNNGPNHLHGGVEKAFGRVMWTGSEISTENAAGVELTYTSADMEEGYPGKLEVVTRYLLTADNELIMEYEATTDKKTVVNLTNHAYFNLSGGENILDHEMMIKSNQYTPVDETLIPTGELRSVEGTPFDFRTPTAIGARIDADDEQLGYGGGYDHNYVLDRSGDGLEKLIEVYDSNSGRVLEISTTEPGVQFYSGNFLDGSITGKGGSVYGHRSAFCLETQHFPDSPNQPDFPSTLLEPGETYSTTTMWKFGVR